MATSPPPRASEALTGRVYKLISPRDTVLGTITIPHSMANALDAHETVNFLPPYEPPGYMLPDPGIAPAPRFHFGTLLRSYTVQGGVMLRGLSIEQFERMPGCAFAPGAAYLRSLLE
ncbi:MAG: hypothetical protein ACRYHQ_24450 [Janthinobacterium lividum]